MTGHASHGKRSLRVLVAEDEFLVGTILEEALLERGHQIVQLCSNYASLEVASQRLRFDVAILDINLAGKMVFPIAQMLRAKGKAFILVTGYGAQSLPEDLRGAQIVAKPCSVDLIENAMVRAYEGCNVAPKEASGGNTFSTLGDLLYAKSKPLQLEADWVQLVQAVADGDRRALLTLYDRASDVVFTLALRICLQRQMAGELTLDVFIDVGKQASDFDDINTAVLAWIMNIARTRSLPHLSPAPVTKASVGNEVLRPDPELRARLARRLDADERPTILAVQDANWEDVAPGIGCKLLASDLDRNQISMLVRLAPDASYPAHTHAGQEELYLLDGELWINGTKLIPGDYNHGRPGGTDNRVWSGTGCTCVLVTSTQDILHLPTDPQPFAAT